MEQLGILDFIIATFVIFGMWSGYQAGLIQSLVSFFGWFVALAAGTRLASVFAPVFSAITESEVLQIALGFLLVVLLVVVIIQITAFILKKLLHSLNMTLLDRITGAVFAVARNVLVVLVLMSVFAPVLVTTSLFKSSVLAGELLPYAPIAETLSKKMLSDAWQQLNHSNANEVDTDTAASEDLFPQP